jgi:hypothetical protein
MWKPDITFSDSQDNYLLRNTEKEPRIPNYPGWRLATYNPFVYNEQYVSGITVYCNQHGFTGIITHGKSHNLTGTRNGCPVHLPLRAGEQILSIWVHRPISIEQKNDREPSLLVSPAPHLTGLFNANISRWSPTSVAPAAFAQKHTWVTR